jgi:hypothetical protein
MREYRELRERERERERERVRLKDRRGDSYVRREGFRCLGVYMFRLMDHLVVYMMARV